jgi:general secretion pathway protein A
MYRKFYGLAKKPFNLTPDPSFLMLTQQHREALAGLTYSILERKGFLVLTGTAGSGKTTLLAWLQNKLSVDRVVCSAILNPTLTRDEFLEMALLNFKIAQPPASKPQRLLLLQEFLMKGLAEGKVHLLVVDEAHKLSAELLEEVRLLGNLESTDEKMLQILLIGQSELDEQLNRPDLWQLKQRIALRVNLAPLRAAEVGEYVGHRWRVAGGDNPPFTKDAIKALSTYSRGVPRVVNSICDNALTLAYADQSQEVQFKHVQTAASDLALIEKPVAAVKVMAAAALARPARSSVPLLRSIEGYSPSSRKPSFFTRWAVKLGLT